MKSAPSKRWIRIDGRCKFLRHFQSLRELVEMVVPTSLFGKSINLFLFEIFQFRFINPLCNKDARHTKLVSCFLLIWGDGLHVKVVLRRFIHLRPAQPVSRESISENPTILEKLTTSSV